jgi:iron complex outermembrane receptor protein
LRALLPLWVGLANTLAVVEVAAAPDLTQLSIEELMSVEVVSPTRQTQKLADSASAIFVITQEDIRRSGAITIPEALRLAPGVQAAQIDASKWAVSVRGFNGWYANKLLVLVDGRSIYNPAFAGVYWEIQDLLMEDIERIEVVRGPGASLWGANAVNGVINIITKRAIDTRNLLSVTTGSHQQPVVGMRLSGAWGDSAHYRAYGKFLRQKGLQENQCQDANDDWREGSGGFRLDWTPSPHDNLSFYGGTYDGRVHQNLLVPSQAPPYMQLEQDIAKLSGGHLQGRWDRALSDTSRWSLQLSYQNHQRNDAIIGFDIDSFDVDFQQVSKPSARHALIWGFGYRHYQDQYQPTVLGAMTPSKLSYELWSGFVQDQISLIPQQLELTLGSRLEHNDFSGWELQPNARLLWTPHPQHRLWGSISHAVRTPSRGDEGVSLNLIGLPPQPPLVPLPSVIAFQGSPDFTSEKVTAYEIGYRTWPTERLSLDVAAFYNDYDDLRSISPQYDKATLLNGQLQIPALFVNGDRGKTYGLEVASHWEVRTGWRLQLAYSYMQADFNNKSGFSNVINVSRDTSPHHRVSLLSSFDYEPDWEFDLWLHYVSALPKLVVATPSLTIAIPDYFSVNARIGWRPRRDLELSLVGTNLLGPAHVEFVRDVYSFPEQVERSIYGQLKWSF